MPGRNLNLVDVLTALGQVATPIVPENPNEILNETISGCERVASVCHYCPIGPRLISGLFLWDTALWGFANWDGAFAQYVSLPQPGYVNAVLTDRPVGYWRLADSQACSGLKALDASGANNDGILMGGVVEGVTGALQPGDPNTAMAFDGTSGYVDIPGGAFSPTDGLSWTVSCWINPSVAGALQFFLSKHDTSPSRNGPVLFTDASSHVHVERWVSGSVPSGITSVGTATAGAFTFVAVTYDGTTMRLYLNGALDSSGATDTTSQAAITAHWQIGGSSSFGAYFPGTIDEVVLYDKALSLSRIQACFNSRAVVPNPAGENTKISASYAAVTLPPLSWADAPMLTPSPVAYWRLDETSGTAISDFTGHGHNGMISGGVTLGVPGLIVQDSDKAMSFDGATGLIDVPYTSAFGFTNALSVASWINPGTLQEGVFLSQENGGLNYWLLSIHNTGGGYVIQWQASIAGSVGTVWSLAAPVNGTTYFVVGTFNGSTVQLYINGVSQGTAGLSGSLSVASTDIRLASDSFATHYLGVLDEVALYNGVLTQNQITTLWNGGTSVNSTATWWAGGGGSRNAWN